MISDMSARPELVRAARVNCVGAYLKLVEHSTNGEAHEWGTVVAFATGSPMSVFNGCLALRPTAIGDFEAAAEWIAQQQLPYEVMLDENVAPELVANAVARGLRRNTWRRPAMVACQPAEAPPAPTGVTVSMVDGPGLGTWLRIREDSGMPLDLARRAFPPSLAADPDVALFVARLNDQPVGTSIAIRTGDICGVYGVSTVPTARGYGVGTAATWAAIRAAREWGCEVITLQASEMGYRTYRRLGFETVAYYTNLS
jgi:N-acetylglutamate synthase